MKVKMLEQRMEQSKTINSLDEILYFMEIDKMYTIEKAKKDLEKLRNRLVDSLYYEKAV
ncbi:hypothetical protein ACFYKX_26610 [Cytobacillus sp. FJAT-54145]|uniref:Uncharacterized protein n=1 Tax=Cytobacillus spartinae TaxID=3299023 RepID=A0ABW6KIQ6_9BACI